MDGPKPCNSRRLLYKRILQLNLKPKNLTLVCCESKSHLGANCHACNASCFFKKKFFTCIDGLDRGMRRNL